MPHNTQSIADYLIIGGGPAAICTVAKLHSSGVPKEQIIWVDPNFTVGDFGSKLSAGSSVPGNTTVESYSRVNNAIYAMIPASAPTQPFELSSLSHEITCPIKIAAKPLQAISKHLQQLVTSIEGTVTDLNETELGIRGEIKLNNNTTQSVIAKRVILAIGSEPRTLSLPKHITVIDPTTSFIASEIESYVKNHPEITSVAVIGSSHSAALAVMHLLKAGVRVTQFMNKEYKFATPAISETGIHYTKFDNTGLKGLVAQFTRELIQQKNNNEGYAKNWQCYIDKNVNALLEKHLPSCSHAVVSIGYVPRNSLRINGTELKNFTHDKHTTQIIDANGKYVPGIYGIGIAFPPEVKSISGEIEFAVGVGKFWAYINEVTLEQWKNL